MCAGRHDKETDCEQPAIPIDLVEDRVVELYRGVQLGTELRQQAESELVTVMNTGMEDAELVQTTLSHQRATIQDKQRKLLEAHYAGAIPIDVLRSEQDSLGSQLLAIDERLSASDVRFESMRANLARALNLLEDCETAYRTAPDQVRRWLNQAFFTRILVTEEDIEVEFTPAMRTLLAPTPAAA